MVKTNGDASDYEQEHVHNVYELIATHFSSTRYKPWPIVEKFLRDMPPGSVGLDVGCGNGKYLAVNRDIYIVASDRSASLVDIASQHQPHSSVVADSLTLPHPHATFDFAISIAVVHHLSTSPRRVAAIQSILATLRRPNPEAKNAKEAGKALIFVWALEQRSSRRGWDVGDDQDVMVPWVLKGQLRSGRDLETSDSNDHVLQRYYHLYCQGELERDILAAGGVVLDSGYEKDNWWAIAAPQESEKS